MLVCTVQFSAQCQTFITEPCPCCRGGPSFRNKLSTCFGQLSMVTIANCHLWRIAGNSMFVTAQNKQLMNNMKQQMFSYRHPTFFGIWLLYWLLPVWMPHKVGWVATQHRTAQVPVTTDWSDTGNKEKQGWRWVAKEQRTSLSSV